MKRNIDDIDVRSKRVLVRVDLNVPLGEKREITDDTRIRAALPTIKALRDRKARTILMSHLGRPDSDDESRIRFSLRPVAVKLAELLRQPVPLTKDCVGIDASGPVGLLEDGDVVLLENLRFHDAETIKDKDAARDPGLRAAKHAFAAQLADLGDVYVNDAFGTCHRDNASMFTVPGLMAGRPRVVGYLVQRELECLGRALNAPRHPFLCVMGGAKVSDKLGVIRAMLQQCDRILIGGAMAFTFMAARGIAVGKSLVEPQLFDVARELCEEAGERLMLPSDVVAATRIETGVETKICRGEIPPDHMGLDIGPDTIRAYNEVIRAAKTIIWNGPMGVFEVSPFDRGTLELARVVADATDAGAVTIIGGGDSAAAITQAGLQDRVTHVSTGGGATLEFLEGKPFPALGALDEA